MYLRIYQTDDERCLFYNYDQIVKNCDGAIPTESYYQVYEGDLPVHSLEEAFSLCNRWPLPEGYRGHSMSVSDLIEMVTDIGEKNNRFFLCDRVGFHPLPPFAENPFLHFVAIPDRDAPAYIVSAPKGAKDLSEAFLFSREAELFRRDGRLYSMLRPDSGPEARYLVGLNDKGIVGLNALQMQDFLKDLTDGGMPTVERYVLPNHPKPKTIEEYDSRLRPSLGDALYGLLLIKRQADCEKLRRRKEPGKKRSGKEVGIC